MAWSLVAFINAGPFLGEVKARPIDIISFSLDNVSKSTRTDKQYRQDTPAKPADYKVLLRTTKYYSVLQSSTAY